MSADDAYEVRFVMTPHPPPIGFLGAPTYWDALKANWEAERVLGCACEFCSGTDICLFQQCWNGLQGKKASAGSSSVYAVAKANSDQSVIIGHNCVGCNERNEHAEPNRADGTYMCFKCRT